MPGQGDGLETTMSGSIFPADASTTLTALTGGLNNALGAASQPLATGEANLASNFSKITQLPGAVASTANAAGLLSNPFSGSGIASSAQGLLGSAKSLVGGATGSATAAATTDTRIRLSAPAGAEEQIYGKKAEKGGNILAPLYATKGLMFPYTPTINFSQDVEYSAFSMVHTNTDYLAYQRTPSVSLTIAGKFTIQNTTEGQYALAAIHFLRTVSKMYFGTLAGDRAGLPPPILWLNGYGSLMFNNLRCILKSHAWSYEEGMDTVLVTTPVGTAKLPAMFTLTVTVTVQQTPTAMRKEFNLDTFRTGALMATGKGWI